MDMHVFTLECASPLRSAAAATSMICVCVAIAEPRK